MKALYHSPEYQPLIAINVILPVAGADYVGPLLAELRATSISPSACWRCRSSPTPRRRWSNSCHRPMPRPLPLIRKSGMEPPR
jgi:hypothetical protein